MTVIPAALRRLPRFARPLGAALALLAGPCAPTIASASTPAPDAPAGCTGPASGTWLKIVAEDVRNSSGNIAITLYPDDSSRFLVAHGSVYVTFIKASQGTATGCVFLPKPGVWVIALYHDENDNHRFDRSSIGLPVEGYGFSNNPPTLMGLPAFRSVRLNAVRSGLTSHIQMKYP
jgi:uncharacterized protein (DUF2141 family)